MNKFFKIIGIVIIIAAILFIVGSFVNIYVGLDVIYRQGIFVNTIVICGLVSFIYLGVKVIKIIWKS